MKCTVMKALAAVALIFMMHANAEAQFTMLQGWVIVPTYKHNDNFEVLLNVRDTNQTLNSTPVSTSGRYMFTNLDLSVGRFDLVINLVGFRESRTPVGPSSGGGNIILIPDLESRRQADEETAYTSALLDEYAKGLEEISSRHPERAVTHLEKVVREVPEFYDARINLGLVYQDLSRMSEAEKEFRKAHDLNEESARPLLVLGRLFFEEAENEIQAASTQDVIRPMLLQAREALTQAVMLDAKLAAAYYYLGAVNFRFKSYPSAERELKHALELNPALYEARIALINVFFDQKLWQAALDNVDMFLLDYPMSPYREEAAAARVRIVEHLH